ncbi:MAG: hypothetical protein ACYS76_01560 [Planctomycetota bacterium]|jgi:hypothetical protein
MKRRFGKNGDEPDRAFGRLAAEKKRTLTAVCLVALMVLMWVRVLLKKPPESVEAALLGQEAIPYSEADPELRISYVELQKVEGRNDVLTRDFFAANGWQGLVGDLEGNTGNVSVVSRDGTEEVVRRVADKLKLQAIWLDRNPQAFINDKLLSVGDRVTVKEGDKAYECEVVEITENTVFIRCGEAEITLKLLSINDNQYRVLEFDTGRGQKNRS